MMMQEWIAAFAEALDVQTPTEGEVQQLLGLAGVAAHASERTAAPLSCWLAAKSGLSAEQAAVVARHLAEDHA
jgi:Domain of unknown function (DUF6457)